MPPTIFYPAVPFLQVSIVNKTLIGEMDADLFGGKKKKNRRWVNNEGDIRASEERKTNTKTSVGRGC